MADPWRFWIDRGGTFTDLVGRSPTGALVVRKVLSQRPGTPEAKAAEPLLAVLREVLAVAPGAPFPPGRIGEVRLGTTVATNALLEHRAEPVLLLVNRGFADLPVIGDQHRPDLFALKILVPRPLAVRVVEVEGRLAADGSELEPLALNAGLADQVRRARSDGYRSCAVALLHSYREPDHERRLGAWLAGLGVDPVVLSHAVSRQPRLVPRCATAVVEAAVRPVLRRYLGALEQGLGPHTRLRVMTSSGALQTPEQLLAKDTILSGPAGGMVGAVAVARAAGLACGPIVGFDMGGTSTDVFHFDGARGEGAWEHSSETEIVGLRLQAPMLPIHTVAAGGGSVLQADGGRLQVGPHSAGADPGPACYRNGGPLTVTDANVLLGRLPVTALPRVFGPGGDQCADAALVREGFTRLAQQLTAQSLGPEALAQGALDIAIERMAEAIRRISIQRGHDIRRAVLVSYGGAGGQHACPLADRLGLRTVLLHPLAGVLSAYGIGLAPQGLLREHPIREPLSAALMPRLAQCLEDLAAEIAAVLAASGDLPPGGTCRRRALVELRTAGSDHGLELPWPAQADPAALAGALRDGFEAEHQRRFGHGVEGEPLVVERLRLEITAGSGEAQSERLPEPGSYEPPNSAAPPELTPLCLPEAEPTTGTLAMTWRSVPLWRREQLQVGQRLEGPALVVDPTGTTVLEPHWSARVLDDGALLLEHHPSKGGGERNGAAVALAATGPDPVRLELYNHRFSAIAEQMGVRLQQSSRSVNIRERLDFSCALFDGAGRLVANAPHIPVHLGSMGESVVHLLRAVERGALPALEPGDAIAANDPFGGGTHLPDITVITPVFAGQGRPVFFVASRGHHADVGGITPGSMPPFSHRIEEEGLRLDNVPLLRSGRFDAAAWRQRLAAGPHPVRNPDQLLADLRAQVAANRLGAEELGRLVNREGRDEVERYMAHVQANAAEAVRRVIDRLVDGAHTVELDDGSRIVLAVRIDRAGRRATVDFSGTSPQQPGNFNAPLAITRAVVLYGFRCLVGEPMPLNAGCFEPIELVVPRGCLLHPLPPAAVVAGNVETSQAVANALFAALGVMAAAQGTMNNLSFGDDRRQYYETICGGTGAGVLADGSGFAGASAVQSHMTNSRLTDPEILEDRFPVRLESFTIRRGSGGGGRWPGGNGVVRRLRFLAPMTASLLSGSRRVAPFGLAGGGDGSAGENRLERADGRVEELGGCAEMRVEPGDLLEIATPGGGGYGAGG